MIYRNLEKLINESLHYYPIVTIMGPRLSGIC